MDKCKQAADLFNALPYFGYLFTCCEENGGEPVLRAWRWNRLQYEVIGKKAIRSKYVELRDSSEERSKRFYDNARYERGCAARDELIRRTTPIR